MFGVGTKCPRPELERSEQRLPIGVNIREYENNPNRLPEKSRKLWTEVGWQDIKEKLSSHEIRATSREDRLLNRATQ
jgi:hypothetical protein